MIPLYILGLLERFGPQHGYQIKKMVEEQLADFTQIKLPTIYYHLDKMEAAGWISAQTGRDGARPEKKVYSISGAGKEHFMLLLRQMLDIRYRPAFDVDGVFYFSDHLEKEELLDGLVRHLQNLGRSLERIEEHRSLTLPHLPGAMRVSADIIFEHHAAHYRAEIAWAQKAMLDIQEGFDDDKKQSDRDDRGHSGRGDRGDL